MREADLDRAFAELSDRGGARAMVKLSKSARRNHLGDRIPEIKASTLLIWGKQDIVTPPEAADQFMSLLRDARIVWFDDCGHAPMIEKPVEFSAAMLDFASQLDRQRA
jgi:pimeloyl-ACP methyl ester carboxylesterase